MLTSHGATPKRLGGVLLVLAVALSACSGSPAPLRGSGSGTFGTARNVGDRPFDIAWVVVDNKGDSSIRLLRVSADTIGALDFDGAYLETAPDNGIAGGITLAPFRGPHGSSISPISNSRHPIVKPKQEAYLIVRVRIPRGQAAGATKTATVYYRSSGGTLSNTYNMPIALCAKAFTGAKCSRVRSETATFSNSN